MRLSFLLDSYSKVLDVQSSSEFLYVVCKALLNQPRFSGTSGSGSSGGNPPVTDVKVPFAT